MCVLGDKYIKYAKLNLVIKNNNLTRNTINAINKNNLALICFIFLMCITNSCGTPKPICHLGDSGRINPNQGAMESPYSYQHIQVFWDLL
jgi:hypothetical protein